MSDTEPIDGQTVPPNTPLTLEQAALLLTIPQRQALTSLIEGSLIKEAAEAAGVHRATLRRWITSHPLFRAAYNAWKQESEESVNAKLHSIVPKALRAIEWGLDEGDARLALKLLQELGLLTKLRKETTDPQLVTQQIRIEQENERRAIESQILPTPPAAPQPPIPPPPLSSITPPKPEPLPSGV